MNEKWLDLSKKVVIVTGGSNGIGEKIVENLVGNGAKAIVADIVKNNQHDGNKSIDYIKCDISNKSEIEEMVKIVVDKYGRIDALVNNAGVGRLGMLVDYHGGNPEYEANEDDFDFMVRINQKGTFLCSQDVARVKIQQQTGVIISITSEAGIEGSIGQSLYAGTKAAVHAFGLSWAKELGPYNIRVIGVEPGVNERTNLSDEKMLKTQAYIRGQASDNIYGDYRKKIPLGREGKLNEIADLISYLISDHASYITGTTINITGGKSKG